MKRRKMLVLLGAILAGTPWLSAVRGWGAQRIRVYSAATGGFISCEKVVRSAAEWRAALSTVQYRVLREGSTEPPFTGSIDPGLPGIYRCAGCGLDLFRAADAYDTGTGWPSFSAPIAEENVILNRARALWQLRNEVICARCEGHLGHLFDDGPPPTGRHYCINWLALSFAAAKAGT